MFSFTYIYNWSSHEFYKKYKTGPNNFIRLDYVVKFIETAFKNGYINDDLTRKELNTEPSRLPSWLTHSNR